MTNECVKIFAHSQEDPRAGRVARATHGSAKENDRRRLKYLARTCPCRTVPHKKDGAQTTHGKNTAMTGLSVVALGDWISKQLDEGMNDKSESRRSPEDGGIDDSRDDPYRHSSVPDFLDTSTVVF